jgi:hypothetical protein
MVESTPSEKLKHQLQNRLMKNERRKLHNVGIAQIINALPIMKLMD